MSYDDFLALGETKHAEFYDGLLTMNPPNRRHAIVAGRLTQLLLAAAPPHHHVLAEWGWQVSPVSVCEPDIMVFPTDAPGEDLLREPPLLIVEVASRSTRSEDWHRKRELYAEGGALWYWIVDPEAASVALLRNDGGVLIETETITEGSHELRIRSRWCSTWTSCSAEPLHVAGGLFMPPLVDDVGDEPQQGEDHQGFQHPLPALQRVTRVLAMNRHHGGGPGP